MLKTQKLTPEIYYKESRDFQLLGRIYDFIFNYVKTEIDLIKTFPLNNNQDTSFIELLLKTLGFKPLKEYQINQLLALASVWINLIKNKGSLTAIDTLIKTILKIENIKENYTINLDLNQDIPTVIIQIREYINSQDIALIEEVLDYILPIGVSFIIQDVNLMNDITPLSIQLEENTSISSTVREEISSLANGDNITETSIGYKYTGTFKGNEKEIKIKKGSIKVGTLNRKKE